MYVLIDIEWVQQNTETYFSQFAAVRVTEDWRDIAGFQHLICPLNRQNTDWGHMAYSGYPPDEFQAGIGEADCIKEFLGFLDADDIILCWHSDTKRLLKEKCKIYTGEPVPNKIICLNNKVHILAAERGFVSFGLYKLAAEAGIDAPLPEHKSTNDVYVIRSLLSALGYDQNNPPGKEQQSQKQAVSRRERNTRVLFRTSHNYIFAPGSQIFHRPTCKLILNANAINGCTYYKTAAKKRRPCKVCRPEPPEAAAPGKQTETKATPQAETNAAPQLPEIKTVPRQPEKKIVMAKLLGDQWIEIANTKIVGCCHNTLHPGKLTRKIMDEHDCIGKNCCFFEKYSGSSFWLAQEAKKRRKAEKKAAQQLQKEASRKLEEELEQLKNLLQSYANDSVHKMVIIRIEKELPNRYKLFYVSEFPFADGNRFPDFLQTVKGSFPLYRIQLRHIRDVDGHFVTTDEYAAVRKRRK